MGTIVIGKYTSKDKKEMTAKALVAFASQLAHIQEMSFQTKNLRGRSVNRGEKQKSDTGFNSRKQNSSKSSSYPDPRKSL